MTERITDKQDHAAQLLREGRLVAVPTETVYGLAANALDERAVREILANALIHQDLAVTGSGPVVEVFSDRVDFTNPGPPW